MSICRGEPAGFVVDAAPPFIVGILASVIAYYLMPSDTSFVTMVLATSLGTAYLRIAVHACRQIDHSKSAVCRVVRVAKLAGANLIIAAVLFNLLAEMAPSTVGADGQQAVSAYAIVTIPLAVAAAIAYILVGGAAGCRRGNSSGGVQRSFSALYSQ